MTGETTQLPPGLSEDQLLAEQMRLVLGHTAAGLVPVFLAVALVGAVLSSSVPALTLGLWCAGVLITKLVLSWDGRRRAARGVAPSQARRLASAMTVAHGVAALTWGLLPWIALDHTSLTGSVLVIAAIAAILGGTISSLSPVLRIYVVYALVLLSVAVVKLLSMGNAEYIGVGAGAMLYALNLVAQARNSHRATRASIELRFQNLALIDRLRKETAHAEQANRMKSKFLAAASHDLRQPVHAQGLFLEVISNTPLSAYQRDALESAKSASRASGEMLDTLLDFSRIEAGVIKAQTRPFAIQHILHKIENDLAPLADAKGLAFRIIDTAAVANSDPTLVEMILRNLVSNAVRYTEHGGVLIAVRRRGDQLVIGVWDTGIGIPRQHQQEVFREFHQLGNPERDRTKGLGLGLAIAQGLAIALGQTLTLASREGRGSIFRLTLPGLPFTCADLIADAPLIPIDNRLLKGIYVLVIEDDAAVRHGMALLLMSWGCECATVESIDEGLEQALRRVPDIIVSDYRLRGQRNGAQAIADIRTGCSARIPALIMTGEIAPERLPGTLATAIEVLHKPVSAQKLHDSMVKLLHSHET